MKKENGFTLLEILVSVAIFWVFILGWMSYSGRISNSENKVHTISARDRILFGVRTMVSLPATLRNSTRATTGSGPLNVALNNCIAGTNNNSCTSGVESNFALFSPIMDFDGAGNPLGVLQITVDNGSGVYTARFDSYGAPCAATTTTCPLIVTTSFVPQCGPTILAGAPPDYFAPLDTFTPKAVCTVADTITVKFSIVLDAAAAQNNPDLMIFVAPVVSSITVSAKTILGNDPQ